MKVSPAGRSQTKRTADAGESFNANPLKRSASADDEQLSAETKNKFDVALKENLLSSELLQQIKREVSELKDVFDSRAGDDDDDDDDGDDGELEWESRVGEDSPSLAEASSPSLRRSGSRQRSSRRSGSRQGSSRRSGSRRRNSLGRHLAFRSGRNIMDLFQGNRRLSELVKSSRHLSLSLNSVGEEGGAGEAQEAGRLSDIWKDRAVDLVQAGKNFVGVMARTNTNLIDQAVDEWADQHLVTQYDRRV